MTGITVGTALAVSAGVAAVGAAVSVSASRQQAKATRNAAAAQREATQAQGRSASVQAARDRMKQIREARIRAGAISSSSSAGGFGPSSSGLAGSISSIGSQASENIGAINVAQGFAESASAAMQVSADQQVKAQRWQAIGQIGGQVAQAGYSMFNQAGGFKTIFDSTPKQ